MHDSWVAVHLNREVLTNLPKNRRSTSVTGGPSDRLTCAKNFDFEPFRVDRLRCRAFRDCCVDIPIWGIWVLWLLVQLLLGSPATHTFLYVAAELSGHDEVSLRCLQWAQIL